MKLLLNLYGFTKEVVYEGRVAPKKISYGIIQEKEKQKPKEFINEGKNLRNIPKEIHRVFIDHAIFEFVGYEKKNMATMDGYEVENIAIYKLVDINHEKE